MEKIYVTIDLGSYVDSKHQIFEINKLNNEEKEIYSKFIKLKVEYDSFIHKYHTNLDIEKYVITYIPHISIEALENNNDKIIYFIASSYNDIIDRKKIYNHDELYYYGIDHYDIIGFYKFDNEDDAQYYFNYAIENNLLPLANNYFLGKYNIPIYKFEKNEYEAKIKKLEMSINEYKINNY